MSNQQLPRQATSAGPAVGRASGFELASHDQPNTANIDSALAAGYEDHGAPGERAVYHPGYYGAFVLDPDGHNVEVVNHNRG